MGDAADDAFGSALRSDFIHQAMIDAGAKPCPSCSKTPKHEDCLICDDLGWIDADGNPCEP